jgi:hypothetical protein
MMFECDTDMYDKSVSDGVVAAWEDSLLEGILSLAA